MNDTHGLLASNEPVATAGELASALNLSKSLLRRFLWEHRARVRCVDRRPEAPIAYAVADVEALVAEQRGALDERRRRTEATRARDRAAAEARAARKAAASKPAPPVPPAIAPPKGPSVAATRTRGGPEVYIVRRRRAP